MHVPTIVSVTLTVKTIVSVEYEPLEFSLVLIDSIFCVQMVDILSITKGVRQFISPMLNSHIVEGEY
jgi:hypothetical protein